MAKTHSITRIHGLMRMALSLAASVWIIAPVRVTIVAGTRERGEQPLLLTGEKLFFGRTCSKSVVYSGTALEHDPPAQVGRESGAGSGVCLQQHVLLINFL